VFDLVADEQNYYWKHWSVFQWSERKRREGKEVILQYCDIAILLRPG
jgi:hypothetical protein